MVVMSGYYGFGNAGDESVLDGIVKLLKDEKEEEVVVLTGDIKYTSLHHPSVKPINRYNIPEIIKYLKKADVFISGGGSLIQNVTSNKSLLYYLTIIQLAQKFCNKCVIFSQGVGPVKGVEWLKKSMDCMAKLDYISVRDADSYNMLFNLGVTCELTTDPAYLCNLDEEDALRILDKYGMKGKKYVAVSIRNYKDNKWQYDLKRCLFDIKDKYPEIVFLNIPFQSPRDIIDLEVPNMVNIQEQLNFRTVKTLISMSDFVIGVRLHSLIFASAANIPFITLNYDPKNLAHANKYGFYSAKIRHIDRFEFVDNFCNMYENREEISEKMKQITDKQIALLRESIKKVL
ncbi:MAG: polysaccharide pyruvyl transferase CsaB [Armatimonadetes bacterium]|nr:polysaccharide pyruvyl transferase CsaB [Candidatus Hippobium faecium]